MGKSKQETRTPQNPLPQSATQTMRFQTIRDNKHKIYTYVYE